MTDMVRDLQSAGIKLKTLNVGNHKTLCPRCSHTRKNKSDPCLSVTIEAEEVAVWNCHNCFWKGSAGNVAGRNYEKPEKKEYVKPEPVKASGMPDDARKYIEGRGITDEVCARNRLYWDAQKNTICFPYYANSELINVKYRTLDKKFRMEKGARLIFYGLDDVRESEELIIVEGEFDKLALEVCGLKNVISVPNGAPAKIRDGEPQDNAAFEYLVHSEELFKKARRVVLAVDSDAAGANLRYELARRIGLHKCFVVEWPQKDANDCLMTLGVDVTLECIRDAKPYPIKGLYEVGDFSDALDDFFENRMRAGSKTGWENLDKLYSVMDGELTVITGIPNKGKSEFLNALMINQAKSEEKKFAVFSPEDGKEQLTSKLIEKIIEKPTDPRSKNRMTIDEFRQGAAWVSRYFFFIVNDDDNDSPTIDWILERARAAVFRYGVRGVVIDPYNEVEHKRQNNMTETEYVSLILSKIKRFAKSHMLHVWLVAHPAKLQTDKDGTTRVPTLYDIAGSANFVNKPDNGIVIHRSEDAADVTEVHVRKVRQKHVGKTGKCELNYNRDTGIYSVPETKYKVREGGRMSDPDVHTYDAFEEEYP